jgi:hypothetical protein
MITLKFLGLPDLADQPNGPIPHLGHLDTNVLGARSLSVPRAAKGLHAWIRGKEPSDPTWSEMQRMTEALRGFSREYLVHAQMRQRLLSVSMREPLLFRINPRRGQLYQVVIRVNLRESMATWLQALGQDEDEVLLTFFVPNLSARSNAERVLHDALQELSAGGDASPSEASRSPGLPEETAASASAREMAIANWLTAEEAGQLLPGRTGAPSQRASRLRRLGQLFAVWVPAERAYRFAPWQFGPSGQPSPILPELLSLLRGHNGVAGGERTSGWEELEWFLAPHALAGGQTPAELVASDPQTALNAARSDFSEGADDARW